MPINTKLSTPCILICLPHKKCLNILGVSLKSVSPLALRYNWQILYIFRCSTWWLYLHIHCEIFITTESQCLGRLIKVQGPWGGERGPESSRRKGSGALKEKKTNFFSTLLYGSQCNNVACSRTCFSFLRTFWLILSSSNTCCGSGSGKSI